MVTRWDIDIQAAHQRGGLSPAPAVDRRTLIRRLSLDLPGPPPTFDDVEGFAADDSPDAEARLVERLLASPAYGERWARHWLDVARYAEDNPTSESTCKPPRLRNVSLGTELFRPSASLDEIGSLVPSELF